MNDKSDVIVLSNVEYRDSDAILRCLSIEGKLAFVAKGIKKITSKNAASCQLYSYSRYFYDYQEQRSLQLLKRSERIEVYPNIRSDLLKQTIASIMVEVVDKIEVDNPAYVFSLLHICLQALELHPCIYTILGYFMSEVNSQIGIQAEVDCCVACGKTTSIVSIDVNQGGFICSSCAQSFHQKVEIEVLRKFRLLHKCKLEQFEELIKQPLYSYADIEVIITFFREYSGVNLKGISFLEHIQTL